MPETKSLQQQIDDLQQLNDSLSKELKCSFDIAHELRIEAFHNEIVSTLINDRFQLSQLPLKYSEQQTRFLETFSNHCQSNTVCIYRLDSASGYFTLESFYTNSEQLPQCQFISADAPAYISNAQSVYCNFVIAPMRYASGMKDIHWYYEKSTQRAILVSHSKQQQYLDMFENLTDKVLRTALQLMTIFRSNRIMKTN